MFTTARKLSKAIAKNGPCPRSIRQNIFYICTINSKII